MVALAIVLIIIFCYLTISVLYSLLFSVAGRVGKLKESSTTGIYRKFAVLMPSYKEDEVILQSAFIALEQTYPKDRFDIVVIADSLKSETVTRLKKMPIKVVEVSFDV